MKNADISDPLFREAVEAIDSGNREVLERLIQQHPYLVREPLNYPEKGYFMNPYLLWFVADNPIRHEKLPANIVDITKLLVEHVKAEAPATFQHQVDYTLGLVVTGRISRECGVQIQLMDLLIDEGAKVGSGLGALAHGNIAATERLIEKGGELNLATAICLDRKDDIRDLAPRANDADKQVALIAVSFYGKADMLRFLIDLGADPNVYIDSSTGFHSHATALHQAIYSGSLDAVKVLMEAGARLDLKDRIYDGTPLGWAQYMQTETDDAEMKRKYKEIEEYLRKL